MRSRSLAVHRLEVEAALVAQPAPVHRVAVDALVAQQLVAARLHGDAAPHRARRAGALGLVEVPRPGLEAVRLGRERPDRADLHGVAAEVRGERLVGEGHDLRLVAPLDEVDERVAGHVLGEPRAAVAEDAPLAVEVDEVADGDGLLVVALLLDHAALARAPLMVWSWSGHSPPLSHTGQSSGWLISRNSSTPSWAFFTRSLSVSTFMPSADRDHAADAEGGAATGVDVDQAHAAHADRLHALVVAEARDVDAVALRRGDDQLARLGLDLLAVER